MDIANSGSSKGNQSQSLLLSHMLVIHLLIVSFDLDKYCRQMDPQVDNSDV